MTHTKSDFFVLDLINSVDICADDYMESGQRYEVPSDEPDTAPAPEGYWIGMDDYHELTGESFGFTVEETDGLTDETATRRVELMTPEEFLEKLDEQENTCAALRAEITGLRAECAGLRAQLNSLWELVGELV